MCDRKKISQNKVNIRVSYVATENVHRRGSPGGQLMAGGTCWNRVEQARQNFPDSAVAVADSTRPTGLKKTLFSRCRLERDWRTPKCPTSGNIKDAEDRSNVEYGFHAREYRVIDLAECTVTLKIHHVRSAFVHKLIIYFSFFKWFFLNDNSSNFSFFSSTTFINFSKFNRKNVKVQMNLKTLVIHL